MSADPNTPHPNDKNSRFLACTSNAILELVAETVENGSPKLHEVQTSPSEIRLSAIAASPDGTRVYATGRGEPDAEGNTGRLLAWERATPGASLKLMGSPVSTRGVTPCYVSLHPTLPLLAVTNFRSPGDRNESPGSVTLFRLDDNGQPLPSVDQVGFPGSGPNLPRQAASHPHSAVFTTSPSVLRVADLGTDSIWSVPMSPDAEKIFGEPARYVAPPGSGPRHMAVVENGHALMYVDEMANHLTWLQPTGALELESVLRTWMMPGPGARGAAADIQVSWDSRFVYATIRGMDEIVGYALDLTAQTMTESVRYSSVGSGPRSLALSPNGHWAALANTSGKQPTLDFLKRDPETGDVERCDLRVTGARLVTALIA